MRLVRRQVKYLVSTDRRDGGTPSQYTVDIDGVFFNQAQNEICRMSLLYFNQMNLYTNINEWNNSILWNGRSYTIPPGQYATFQDIFNAFTGVGLPWTAVVGSETVTYTFPGNANRIVFQAFSSLRQMFAFPPGNDLILIEDPTYTTEYKAIPFNPPQIELVCSLPGSTNLEYSPNGGRIQYSQTLCAIPLTAKYGEMIQFAPQRGEYCSFDIRFTPINGSHFTYTLTDGNGSPLNTPAEYFFGVEMSFYVPDENLETPIVSMTTAIADKIGELNGTFRTIFMNAPPPPPSGGLFPPGILQSNYSQPDIVDPLNTNYFLDLVESLRSLRSNYGVLQSIGISDKYTIGDSLLGLWDALGPNLISATPHLSVGSALTAISLVMTLQTAQTAIDQMNEALRNLSEIGREMTNLVGALTDLNSSFDTMKQDTRDQRIAIQDLTNNKVPAVERAINDLRDVVSEETGGVLALGTIATALDTFKTAMETTGTQSRTSAEAEGVLNREKAEELRELAQSEGVANRELATSEGVANRNLAQDVAQNALELVTSEGVANRAQTGDEGVLNRTQTGDEGALNRTTFVSGLASLVKAILGRKQTQQTERLNPILEEVERLREDAKVSADPTRLINEWVKKHKTLRRLNSAEEDVWKAIIDVLDDIVRLFPNEELATWLLKNSKR